MLRLSRSIWRAALRCLASCMTLSRKMLSPLSAARDDALGQPAGRRRYFLIMWISVPFLRNFTSSMS